MDEAGLERLLAKAQQHDPAAMHSLVQAYSPRVYGLIFRMTGSRDAAEELVQATFLRVVRMLPTYQHSGRFTAWLFRIASNLVRDRARRNERRRRAFEPDAIRRDGEQLDSPDPGEPGPAARLLSKEAGERLQASLDRLPEADREIILLRHFSDMPFRDIAEMLNIPLGTALSRAHRALARLKDDLGDWAT